MLYRIRQQPQFMALNKEIEDPKTSLLDLLVYYEVPQDQREQVKQKFGNFIRNIKELNTYQQT